MVSLARQNEMPDVRREGTSGEPLGYRAPQSSYQNEAIVL